MQRAMAARLLEARLSAIAFGQGHLPVAEDEGGDGVLV
jgi:hypothetical protein